MTQNCLEPLRLKLAKFAEVRDWNQFHSPKNLSMALIAEAAELVEIFQWLSEPASQALTKPQQDASREELADILIYLVRIADKLDIDLIQAAYDKIELNELRYPADKVKGDARRASDYDDPLSS